VAQCTQADLRRSNYGDTHITCVPTGEGGGRRVGEFTVTPRCSLFTDTDLISTRNPAGRDQREYIFDVSNAPRYIRRTAHARELQQVETIDFRAAKFWSRRFEDTYFGRSVRDYIVSANPRRSLKRNLVSNIAVYRCECIVRQSDSIRNNCRRMAPIRRDAIEAPTIGAILMCTQFSP